MLLYRLYFPDKKTDHPKYFEEITDDVDNLSNLPFEFIEEKQGATIQHQIFPRKEDIIVTNQYWQRTVVDDKIFNLLNAFFDDRLSLKEPLVRIIAMSKDEIAMRSHETVGKDVPLEIFCQFWMEGEVDPIVELVTEFRYLWWDDSNNDNWMLGQAYHLVKLMADLIHLDWEIPNDELLAKPLYKGQETYKHKSHSIFAL